MRKAIEAIHIISHGSPGSLNLGSETISNQNLNQFSHKIQQWGKALTKNADILLYGCNIAATETGLQFIQNLHQLTGANIAASNNKTGNRALGGDWELEVKIGTIQATPIQALAYRHILAAIANPDNKALTVSGAPTSTQIDVLANDTGTGRLNVQSIATAPTNGTAIINDWIYVGGLFTTIGGVARNSIARLNSDGTVDPTFNPNANFSVNAIALDSSGNPIVGGVFTTIGGSTRNYIAKLNPSTGVADATFNPNANFSVDAIALDSSGNPIVGGAFSTIGGSTRNRIAKLNPTTGAADATFNPNANNFVLAIAIDRGREIFYTPNANFNGVDTFTYIAKDTGTPSTAATVTVLVNDSPTLDTTGTPTLNAQNQNDTASTGTLISTIIANLGGTKITDPNTAASQGIAITALNTANGSWQYTTNGTTWNNTPTVSATNALLLASGANTKIRLVPNAGYNGTVANGITFAAWDQITGTNGGVANYTTNRSHY